MKVLDKCEFGYVAGLCSKCENFVSKENVASFKCKVHGVVEFFPEVEGFTVNGGSVFKGTTAVMYFDEGAGRTVNARPVSGKYLLVSAYLSAIGDKMCKSKEYSYLTSTLRTEYYNMLLKIGKSLKRKKSIKIIGVTSDLKYILSNGDEVEDVKC